MSGHVKRNPDGTFELDGEPHRLVERGEDRYDLERVRDGARLGGFTLPPPGDAAGPVVDAPEGRPSELVRKVAEMLGSPRGILPLQ
jgi:hypothetical protein